MFCNFVKEVLFVLKQNHDCFTLVQSQDKFDFKIDLAQQILLKKNLDGNIIGLWIREIS